jgi:hypothetical protein
LRNEVAEHVLEEVRLNLLWLDERFKEVITFDHWGFRQILLLLWDFT